MENDIVKMLFFQRQRQKKRWKIKTISGAPPLSFKAKAGALKDYRIYGNTAGGEAVGDLETAGEHAGEYKVPVTVSNGADTQTIPIYLTEQIKKVGDEAEYVDYETQKWHRVRKNLFDKSKPANILKCYLSVSTLVSSVETRTIFIECKPSTTYTVSKIQGKRFAAGWSDKLPAAGVELQEKVVNYNTSSITITTGLAAKYLVAYIYSTEQDAPITVDEMIASVQIEKGSTATPYEPYIENTDLDVTLPALPTFSGTNTLTVGTEVQPSGVEITGRIKKGE